MIDAFETSGASPPALPLAAASVRLRGRPGRQRTHRDGETVVRPFAEPRASRGAEPRPVAQPASAPSPVRLLTARETARYLGLGYDTVLQFVKTGTLRPVRLPLGERGDLRKLLFDHGDLDRLIETSK